METIVSNYNTITMVLLSACVAAAALAVYFAILLCLRWRTPRRSRYAKLLGVAVVASPCLFGIQQALLWRVLLPAMGRQQMAEMAAYRERVDAETSSIRVGDAAPNISITDINGIPLNIDGDSGNVILINFFATWCGPCLKELPHIESIWSDYYNSDHFRLLVIGREESVDAVRRFRDKHGFTFPVASDLDRSVYSKFAKESLPRTIVISPSGKVVYSQSGFDENDLITLRSVVDRQLKDAAKRQRATAAPVLGDAKTAE